MDTVHAHVLEGNFKERAHRLAELFREDAAERDKQGGTPKAQRDAIRESGLLRLLIPREYGGEGRPWSDVLEVIRILAEADPSLAHLYGYHFLILISTHLAGTVEQKRYYYTETAVRNWFWGNSTNPLDRGIIGTRDREGVILTGSKSFSSGSPDSDILGVSWHDSVTGEYYEGIVPTGRSGIEVKDDWDAIGQRQTGSGTVAFDHVRLEESEILETPYDGRSAFTTVVPIISQSILANIFIGIAAGAIAEARQYTLTSARAWPGSGVERAAEEPSTHRRYGELWMKYQSALSLVEKAAVQLDQLWKRDILLTEEERGDCAVLVAAANVQAGDTALALSSAIFEVMGARSAASHYGYDRFWRNARTHTLHNPAEFKLRGVGDWVLNGRAPQPGYYS